MHRGENLRLGNSQKNQLLTSWNDLCSDGMFGRCDQNFTNGWRNKIALESDFEEHAQEVWERNWMNPAMQTTLLNTYPPKLIATILKALPDSQCLLHCHQGPFQGFSVFESASSWAFSTADESRASATLDSVLGSVSDVDSSATSYSAGKT